MKPLLFGGFASILVSILHVLIIIGGPDWYRFFGAGEEAARLAAQGSDSNAVTTAAIALIFALFGLYGVFGATGAFRLPFQSAALILIATLFLVRGLLGVPAFLMFQDTYLDELKGRMVFVVLTSLVSAAIGACYLHGLVKIGNHKETSNRVDAAAVTGETST
ncbi:MAG: hypothetical protein IPP19_07980 [Verrucomicrobia bacterium]|nr:hypothetical protein [Verrucomicrobiota bacterium]